MYLRIYRFVGEWRQFRQLYQGKVHVWFEQHRVCQTGHQRNSSPARLVGSGPSRAYYN